VRIPSRSWIFGILSVLLALSAQGRGPELTPAKKARLDSNFQQVLRATKGPYTQNFCVCRDGKRKPVFVNGKIVSPCGGRARFCAAWREPFAAELGNEGVYLGNLFARDLHTWDEYPNPHNLVRGYILEKFFFETHPDHKLAKMRAYGGLAGAEFEARDAPQFFERYLADEKFDQERYYLLAYELQRRFYVRNDQGRIGRARALSVAIQRNHHDFKPLRDAIHNQITAALTPRLEAYREKLTAGTSRDRLDELITEIQKLTSLDDSSLRAQIPKIEDASTRAKLEKNLSKPDAKPLARITALADMMVDARKAVGAKKVTPADRRRLIDIAVTTAGIISQEAGTRLSAAPPITVRQDIELLMALTNAAYGSGLLMEREREVALKNLQKLLGTRKPQRGELQDRIARAARIIEWAQRTTLYAFGEVEAPWVYLMPDVALLPDDIIRSSPLLVYGKAIDRLQHYAEGQNTIQHEIFGHSLDSGVRALNSGIALGTLRVNPPTGGYQRNEIVALAETPSDLEPAAGILTRGEGNVVSHVQLLARSLGIPNVVLGPTSYKLFQPHDGQKILMIVTPGGQVVIKTTVKMTREDRELLAEYSHNQEREDDGRLGETAKKLHIDVKRLDVKSADVIDLTSMRRKDSGVRGGPKASFLGELKHHFPDKVARGIVVPFGAYYAHYRAAPVAIPPKLAKSGIAKAGEPLHEFVERTYKTFFDEMIPKENDEKKLETWIRPRLAIMRYSLESWPLSSELREGIRKGLEQNDLLRKSDPSQTVGLFVRSDTNVEDLENFNGAGLNLTLFNRRSLEDVYSGLREVWASPFTYRSFSWRQTLIDEPLWVLPSVVILESVPNTKSGVLVTAGLNGQDQSKILIATSEGVGGAVDGTPAETLVWSPDEVELVEMFKSPYRRLLRPDGGSEIVPSTGQAYVLSKGNLADVVSTAQGIRKDFKPSVDPEGNPRPWDVEFGFSDDQLWLFQTRPFIGNESMRNIPALTHYERAPTDQSERVSLDAPLPRAHE
jgi:hypothetical protein